MSKILKYLFLVGMLVLAAIFGFSGFSFHGRIVDQNGAPVVGAKIRAYVGGDSIGGGSGIALAETDANGYFAIEDKKGASLQILDMSKPNYEISLKRQPSAFMSALNDYQREHMQSLGDLRRHNSSKKAFIFNAWKLDSNGQITELISGDRRFGFKGDGRTYIIDLTRKGSMKSSGVRDGMLLVQFWNAADQEKWKMNDWRFSVSAINGAIVEAPEDYLNIAPESGYVSGFEFTKDETFGADSLSTPFIRHFFFRNNELTGRISMKFEPVRRNTTKYDGIIAMDYSLNIAGGTRVRGFDFFD